MSFDVWSELVSVRERVTRIETTLEEIKRVLDKQPTTSGGIIIPVSLATAIIQGSIALVQHFT